MSMLEHWRNALNSLYLYYRKKRPPLIYFYPILFLFFVVLNDLCYWWAMITAFPELVFGYPFKYYFKVQFPVAFLGAMFDSMSFFLTIQIIKHALKSNTTIGFIGHLSLDIAIAILATFWVLFVFTFSSWLIHLTEPTLDTQITERQELYAERVSNAIREPTKNLKNIYFGIIMGVSASLPTFIHIFLALKSILSSKLGSRNRN